MPEVPGVLTAGQVLATGRSVAGLQQATGAIGWPDGHADAWNHVECAMALTACGLTGPARRAYQWLAGAQRAGRILAEGDHRHRRHRRRRGEQPGRLRGGRRLA